MPSTNRHPGVSRFLAAAAVLSLPLVLAQPCLAGSRSGDVYVLSNQTDGNSVIVFHRDAMGMLTLAGTFASGGNGAGSGADPLGSENPVVLGRDGQLLFAVNAGSNSISAFRVSGDKLIALNTVDSGGTLPVSLAVRHGLVYALNAGGTPNVSGFTVDPKTGDLVPLQNSTQPVPGGSSSAPAEISFNPKENVLMVTETATNEIDTFVLNADGTARPGVAFPSSEPTPFGFAFGHHHVAVVSDAEGGASGASALSSYKVKRNGNLNVVTAGVNDTQTAACWVAVTGDGRFAYTANTGSGTISSYTVSNGGELALLDVTAGSGNVPVDMAMSHNSRFLYARNAGDGTIGGFRVRSDGRLIQLAAVGALPDGAAGIAAR